MLSADIKCIDWSVKMPLLQLPTRTVVVRTKDGSVVFSPPPNGTQDADKIEAFGPVTDIVAPNLFHDMGIKDAIETYPEARGWACAGFSEKMGKLTEIGSSDFGHDELTMFPLAGAPKMNEVVALHRPSRTLICSDLCFNYLDGKGFGYWAVFKMFGTYRRFAVSKMFAKMIKDQDAFVRSLAPLFDEDFDNIVMSHGDVVLGNGKEKLAYALHERGLKVSV